MFLGSYPLVGNFLVQLMRAPLLRSRPFLQSILHRDTARVRLLLGWVVLFTLPASREYIIQRLLKRPAVHVDQTLFLAGLWVTNHRDETKIPTKNTLAWDKQRL